MNVNTSTDNDQYLKVSKGFMSVFHDHVCVNKKKNKITTVQI